jgi:hypothetical protein
MGGLNEQAYCGYIATALRGKSNRGTLHKEGNIDKIISTHNPGDRNKNRSPIQCIK